MSSIEENHVRILQLFLNQEMKTKDSMTKRDEKGHVKLTKAYTSTPVAWLTRKPHSRSHRPLQQHFSWPWISAGCYIFTVSSSDLLFSHSAATVLYFHFSANRLKELVILWRAMTYDVDHQGEPACQTFRSKIISL